jgi:hypothetical protein
VADQQRRWGRGILRPRNGMAKWCLVSLALLALAACGHSMPPPPAASGGVYTSAAYHFRLTYPSGWEVSTPTGTAPSLAIPLEIVVTRVNAQAAGGGQVSSFTVVVFDAQDATVTSQIKSLEKQVHSAGSKYLPITISGVRGYQSNQSPTIIPGSQITDTHTDYYLITTDYEYQISTDALSDDNAAGTLHAMVQSFTLLK